MITAGVVIVGGGQAGAQAAISLRDGGYNHAVTIIGSERVLPYQRPPLSKAFLLGAIDETGVRLRQPEFYLGRGIEVVEGRSVSKIDRGAKQVETADGVRFAYEFLVLATGVENRPLPVPGADLDGVVYLRTLDEARHIKNKLVGAENVVIVGAGFIGLELASVAAKLGAGVTVFESMDRCMSRVVSPEMSSYFERKHRERGVAFHFSDQVIVIGASNGKVDSVKTAAGAILRADLVIVAVGVTPRVELAESSGLAIHNGILVDDHLTTIDPSIYAIGDCAAYPNVFANAVVRLESVQNAIDQGKYVAAAICGEAKPFHAVPWFWSDQSDDKLQIAGLGHPSDHLVTIGDVEQGKFSVLRFRSGSLAAVESVNRVTDHVSARKILQSGRMLRQDQVMPNLDLRDIANDNSAKQAASAATVIKQLG